MRKTLICLAVALGAAALEARAAEPTRSVLLDNETLRVVEVTFESGDSELQHSHDTAFIAFFVTPGRLENVLGDASVEQVGGATGDVWFVPAGTTHLARNASKDRVVIRVAILK